MLPVSIFHLWIAVGMNNQLTSNFLPQKPRCNEGLQVLIFLSATRFLSRVTVSFYATSRHFIRSPICPHHHQYLTLLNFFFRISFFTNLMGIQCYLFVLLFILLIIRRSSPSLQACSTAILECLVVFTPHLSPPVDCLHCPSANRNA